MTIAPLRRSMIAPCDLRKTGINPDFWYPLARSRDVRPGKMLGVHFAGEPIVLVRPTGGSRQRDVFALEDRCAHRQVPLHLGAVKGDRLSCSYHCWTYDRTGRCVTVPYLDETRSLPNGVRAYPAREAYGFVFVFPGDAAKAASVPFPEVPRYADPCHRTRVLDRRIDCHYSFMHENLMDMNHQFLHRSLMGSIRATPLALREGEDWLEVDYTFRRAAGKQPVGEWFIIKRRRNTNPDAGSRDIMTIRTHYPYQTLRFWTAGSSEPALDLWNIYVPLDREQRRNQTYGLMMVRKPRLPGLMHVMWPFIVWFTNGIFAQDRSIVEAEQRACDELGGDHNQEIFPIIQKLKQLLTRQGVLLPQASHDSCVLKGVQE
jgi:phenylpropionate dioxygenase-like ring-hydroxylating dioxygenase large terminal subunit